MDKRGNPEDYMLTAQQYYRLCCKAFAELDRLATLAEQTMKALEELQLSMADEDPCGQLIPFPSREKTSETEET